MPVAGPFGEVGEITHMVAEEDGDLSTPYHGSGEHVTLRAGAGIVADSDPEAELEETRAKAEGMLRALRR